MKSLDEKSWVNFKVPEIFNHIQRGKRLKKADQISGKVPYVSSTEKSNGVDNYIEVTKGSRVFEDCISLANSGSVGKAFYEPFKYVASDHVTSLKRDSMSKYIYLFLATTIEYQRSSFNFNREINDARIHNMQIMLPASNELKPDYAYMSDYMVLKCNVMLDRYCEYAEHCVSMLGNTVGIKSLIDVNWGEFRIGDLFDISRPSVRNKDDYCSGNIPFVASGSINNGVMKLCKLLNDESLDKGCCITVSPVDGSTFYQPMDFLGRGGAGSSVLILRNENLNLYCGQFLARAIQQTCSKYTYGHMGNKDSIKRERILLPVDENGNPDYMYMEQYIKNMMLKKYKQYLSYLEEKSDV